MCHSTNTPFLIDKAWPFWGAIWLNSSNGYVSRLNRTIGLKLDKMPLGRTKGSILGHIHRAGPTRLGLLGWAPRFSCEKIISSHVLDI